MVLPIALARPAAQAPNQATPALSPRNANYRINARLDVPGHIITADETITWRNTSSRPADSLRFHLYYNAWRNDQSTWMRERRLADSLASTTAAPGDRSSIDISTVKIVTSGGA